MDQVTVGTQTTFAAFKADSRISFIRPYDPKACNPVADYRHAVVRFRDTGKNTASRPAQVVTIPQVTLPEGYTLPDAAAKVLLGVIEDQQDEMIRSAILSDSKLINWDDISIDKALEALTAIQTSQRLTKEQIESWVMAAMLASLNQRGVQVCESKGYQQGSEAWNKQIAGIVNNYKVKFAALAAPVPNLKQEEAIALKNMLAVSKVSDDISKSLGKKIHAILNPEILEGVEL